jgi:hypothetical protein
VIRQVPSNEEANGMRDKSQQHTRAANISDDFGSDRDEDCEGKKSEQVEPECGPEEGNVQGIGHQELRCSKLSWRQGSK